ncbi:signal peptidase II [Patescibacteria group bacterium]|nr:signal peptidase II [Patescibacteria group bacterium]
MRKRKGQIIFFLIVVLDQFLKLVTLKRGSAVLNRGISFGLFNDSFSFEVLLVVLPVLLGIFLFVSIFKLSKNFGLVLILSGGFSNYLDRIIKGGVVDYLKIWFFPHFNLADLAITLGFVWFLVDFVKKQTV